MLGFADATNKVFRILGRASERDQMAVLRFEAGKAGWKGEPESADVISTPQKRRKYATFIYLCELSESWRERNGDAFVGGKEAIRAHRLYGKKGNRYQVVPLRELRFDFETENLLSVNGRHARLRRVRDPGRDGYALRVVLRQSGNVSINLAALAARVHEKPKTIAFTFFGDEGKTVCKLGSGRSGYFWEMVCDGTGRRDLYIPIPADADTTELELIVQASGDKAAFYLDDIRLVLGSPVRGVSPDNRE